MNRFATDFWLPCPPARAFAFFAEARNLDRVTPPWFRFEILTPTPIAMAEGTVIDYRLRWRLANLAWRSRVTVWRPAREFTYEQARGPFLSFRHDHRFEPEGGGVRIADLVEYRVLGGAAAAWLVNADLGRIFRHRARSAARLLTGGPSQASAPSLAAPRRSPSTSASSSAIEEPT